VSESALVSAREAADELGVNERTIRRAIEAGRLHAERNGRGYLIDLSDARVLFSRTGRMSGCLLLRENELLREENDRLWALLEKAMTA
jgi:excisionase family DNA binding protein